MKIVLIGGKAQHGKSTFANMLQHEYEKRNLSVIRVEFAHLLKFYATKYFGWDGNKDEEGRTLLQWLGTDLFREKDPDYWARNVYDFLDVIKNHFDIAIIDDWRFINEERYFHYGTFEYFPVKIERQNFESSLTEDQKNHRSEKELEDFKASFTVYNRTMERLQKSAKDFVDVTLYPYPEYKVYENIEDREKRQCWHCGVLTTSIDFDFEAFLCSDYCREKKRREFEFAIKESE
jgi:hypothetical protein